MEIRDKDKEHKEGAYDICPKCGNKMYVLFNVFRCKICDDKERNVDESKMWEGKRWWSYTIGGME